MNFFENSNFIMHKIMENKINWQPSRNGISIQTINLYLNLNEVPRIAEE